MKFVSVSMEWQVRELLPTSQAYETRLDSGPPASMKSRETRVESREPEKRFALSSQALVSQLSALDSD